MSKKRESRALPHYFMNRGSKRHNNVKITNPDSDYAAAVDYGMIPVDEFEQAQTMCDGFDTAEIEDNIQ